MMNESIYHITTSGNVRVVELPDGMTLEQLYCKTLRCKYFQIIANHHMQDQYDLFVVGDEESKITGGVYNAMLTKALGKPFYGDAVLVCLHAVGENGDDTRLVDVSCIYSYIEKYCSASPEKAAKMRTAPLSERVRELVEICGLSENPEH